MELPGWVATLDWVTRESLSQKVTFDLRPEQWKEANHLKIWVRAFQEKDLASTKAQGLRMAYKKGTKWDLKSASVAVEYFEEVEDCYGSRQESDCVGPCRPLKKVHFLKCNIMPLEF